MIHVAIAGIDTGLGQAIARLVEDAPDMELTGGTTIVEHHSNDCNGIVSLLDRSTALVDVTSPADMMVNAIRCLSAGCTLVGGAGPLDPNHIAELRDYSRRIPVFYAPDLCIETAALLSILPELCSRVPHLRTEVTGLDQHRRRRVAEDLRHVAEPVVFLTGEGQEILISQRVYGHAAAAQGAIRALTLLADQDHGFFTMEDLLQPAAPVTGQPEMARVS